MMQLLICLMHGGINNQQMHGTLSYDILSCVAASRLRCRDTVDVSVLSMNSMGWFSNEQARTCAA